MFRVKLCGFTREKDVREAVRLGIDAVGFQMSRGPRKISPGRARRLTRLLPPWSTPVGVFVDEPLARVNRLVASCGFQAVQLHGKETPSYAGGVSVPVIRAVRVRADLDPRGFGAYSVAAFLLDRYNPRLSGGTGEVFPWKWAGKARALPAPFLLAGGLHPGNVVRAVRACRPFGVDAASGVESSPGVKDARKMADFVKRARSVLTGP